MCFDCVMYTNYLHTYSIKQILLVQVCWPELSHNTLQILLYPILAFQLAILSIYANIRRTLNLNELRNAAADDN